MSRPPTMSEYVLAPLHPPVVSVQGEHEGAPWTDDPTDPSRTVTESWVKLGITIAFLVVALVGLIWLGDLYTPHIPDIGAKQ